MTANKAPSFSFLFQFVQLRLWYNSVLNMQIEDKRF